MILTFHPDPKQEKLINELKQIYFEKTATNAIFRAIKYAVEDQQNDKNLIDTLKEEIEALKEKDQKFKAMIKTIKQASSRLFDYCEMPSV